MQEDGRGSVLAFAPQATTFEAGDEGYQTTEAQEQLQV